MAEFEELKLTVNLQDNASAGLQSIRNELAQLTSGAQAMTANLRSASEGITNLGRASDTAAPRIRTVDTAMVSLRRSSVETGRGLALVFSSIQGGLSNLPQLATGLKEAAGGISGISEAAGQLAPALRMSTLAIGGMALGVVALGAAIAIYGVSVFRFSREMHQMAQTAKAMGSSFADMKVATDHAKQFGYSTATAIQNLAGLQKAQTDLARNNSTLRNEMVGKGLDPNWLNQFSRTTEAWKAHNMVREKGLQIQNELIRKGYTERAARGEANEFARSLGYDANIYDTGKMVEPTREQRAEMERIKDLSAQVDKIWGSIGATWRSISFTALSAGLPYLLGALRFMDATFKGISWAIGKINEGLSYIGTKLDRFIPIYGPILRLLGQFAGTGGDGGGTPGATPQSYSPPGGGGGLPGVTRASYSPPGGNFGGPAGTGSAGAVGLPAGTGGSTSGSGGRGGGAATGALADRIGVAKAAAMDQLRKEGVPEANVEEAANVMVGQAIAESNLNPNAVHDQGTGAGIYGARDPPGGGKQRRTEMFKWMRANGYEPGSLEGQMRYMAHEAMTDKAYGKTRSALLNATPQNRVATTNTVTRDFERPAVPGDRSGHVGTAAGVKPGPAGPPYEGQGAVKELQGKVAAVRKGELDAGLKKALDYAASKNGLTVEVTSGGQRMPGAPGATGSHRHDGGHAADFNLRDADGKIVPPDDPRALQFFEDAAHAGATGGGAGYMSDPNKIHLDVHGGVYAGSKKFREAMRRGTEKLRTTGAPKFPEVANKSPIDTGPIDRNNGGGTVTSKGELNVKVDRGPNDKVDYNGTGLLKPTEIEQTTQMPRTRSGPMTEEGGWT